MSYPNIRSLFDNMTDEEFEKLLIKHGFKFEKANECEGGILYKGVLYKTYEEYEKVYKPNNIQN